MEIGVTAEQIWKEWIKIHRSVKDIDSAIETWGIIESNGWVDVEVSGRIHKWLSTLNLKQLYLLDKAIRNYKIKYRIE